MTPPVCQLARERLVDALAPVRLEITDESDLHAGHPGAQSGGRHLAITIASAEFVGKSPLVCHRLVYAALSDLIGREIHAARITCANE